MERQTVWMLRSVWLGLAGGSGAAGAWAWLRLIQMWREDKVWVGRIQGYALRGEGYYRGTEIGLELLLALGVAGLVVGLGKAWAEKSL